MPWTYTQATGVTRDPQGNTVATGYSGSGTGKNNSFKESERNVGPIPRGTYTIGNARTSNNTGPVSMDLAATASTHTFGRSAFLIHGDNASHTASHGCVILPRNIRETINSSTDKELVVQ
jgi:hypothetical protein